MTMWSECTFICLFNTGARKQGNFRFFRRYIVFSVPRDSRRYPDTLWFSEENQPAAVSLHGVPRIRDEKSTVDRADDDDARRERETHIGERATKLILFSAFTHLSAIFRHRRHVCFSMVFAHRAYHR